MGDGTFLHFLRTMLAAIWPVPAFCGTFHWSLKYTGVQSYLVLGGGQSCDPSYCARRIT